MGRSRMSENERLIFFCLLFPVFWIFIPFIAAGSISTSLKTWWSNRKKRNSVN